LFTTGFFYFPREECRLKVVGIDYGRRRVGIAASDETGTFARSIGTIDRQRCPDIFEALHTIVAAQEPQHLVMGLPLNIENNETAMSAEVRVFATELSQRCNLPVVFTDEAYSSKQAQQLLGTRKKKHRRQKHRVDSIAACLIVEQFLRELKGPLLFSAGEYHDG
jgi:putative Holliday junction resolvase